MTRWVLVEGKVEEKVESSPEDHEPSAKRETGFEATLMVCTFRVWGSDSDSLGPS